MIRAGVAFALVVTACSPEPRGREVDIGNAARAAQGSVDRYIRARAAARLAAREAKRKLTSISAASTVLVPAPGPLPEPVHASANQDHALVRADDASDLVRRYFDLIEQRRYRAAWSLWDREGAASGLSVDDFAATFTSDDDYQAKVGAAGKVEAGAGQRYVSVPVQAYATLRNGKALALHGSVTLHRVGDIDGATASQRRWRIHAVDLQPRPGVPAVKTAPTGKLRDNAPDKGTPAHAM